MIESEARRIIQQYEKLIRKIANRAARKTSAPTHDADDFFVIGMEASLKAVECYSAEHGVAEPAWVARLVRQAIDRELGRARTRGFRKTDGALPALESAHEEAAAAVNGRPGGNLPHHAFERWLEAQNDAPIGDRLRWLQGKVERLLTPIEQQVLQAVFSGQSENSFAEQQGVSKQRISQVKSNAIEKLKRSARLTFRVA